MWNKKYDIDHEELEEKISMVANELGLSVQEVISDLEDLRWQHEDWEIDKLLEEVKRCYLSN